MLLNPLLPTYLSCFVFREMLADSSMNSSESIEELARLLTEEKRLDKKLQETQEVLSTVKKKVSESLVTPHIHKTEGPVPIDESLVQKEQSFERLLEALRDMKREIQTRIRPIEVEIVQVNIKNLTERYENQKKKLGEALDTIDQTILDCGELVENSKKIHLELADLNEKLSHLGASPLPIQYSPRDGDIGELVRHRIEHLRLQSKL